MKLHVAVWHLSAVARRRTVLLAAADEVIE
jgi:hypothetical protein